MNNRKRKTRAQPLAVYAPDKNAVYEVPMDPDAVEGRKLSSPARRAMEEDRREQRERRKSERQVEQAAASAQPKPEPGSPRRSPRKRRTTGDVRPTDCAEVAVSYSFGLCLDRLRWLAPAPAKPKELHGEHLC